MQAKANGLDDGFRPNAMGVLRCNADCLRCVRLLTRYLRRPNIHDRLGFAQQSEEVCALLSLQRFKNFLANFIPVGLMATREKFEATI